MKLRAFLIAAALALLAVAFTGDRFWLQFLGRAMIACILAMSLDLLVGYTGLVSLAHCAFFGLAAYALAGLSNRFGIASPLLTLPACIACACAAALVIGWLSLRASGVYFIMVTLAFAQMLFYLFNDSPDLGGSDGVFVALRPVPGRLAAYLLIWAALVLVYLIVSRLLRAPAAPRLVGDVIHD